MDKLKPCPFCGSVNLAQDAALSDYIECRDCGAYGPDGGSDGWDTRADSAELTAANARIAELEKALGPFAREDISGTYRDSWHLHFSDEDGFVDHTDFTVGDLRRAAALLEKK